MKINYTTGKLPTNFVILGAALLVIGIWEVIRLEWGIGIFLFVVGLFLFFIKSGIMIDADKKQLKQYIGILGIKKGRWENIDTLLNLKIIKSQQSQAMNVLTISTTTTVRIYKLLMVLPDKNIEILTGKKKPIFKMADKISTLLDTSVENSVE